MDNNIKIILHKEEEEIWVHSKHGATIISLKNESLNEPLNEPLNESLEKILGEVEKHVNSWISYCNRVEKTKLNNYIK